MGRKCVALGCNSSNNGKTSIMFHKFPQNDPERFAKWLELCPPELKIDKGRILLCSRHFHRDQYLNFNDKKPKLVHNAVPFKKRGVAPKISKSQETPSQSLFKTSYTRDIRIQPLQQKDIIIEDSAVYLSEINKHTSTELCDDPLVVEVNMKDSGLTLEDEEGRAATLTPTNHVLILENMHLKLDNKELQRELATCKQRLAFLEKHVHNLSRLTGTCDCLCLSCTNSII